MRVSSQAAGRARSAGSRIRVCGRARDAALVELRADELLHAVPRADDRPSGRTTRPSPLVSVGESTRSSTKRTSSAGTGFAVRLPNVRSSPRRPPRCSWKPSTFSSPRRASAPCSPMSAIWYWAQAFGQPFTLIRTGGSRSPMRSSRWAISAATSLVSLTASRQNSMPVHEIVWRRNELASTGAPAAAISTFASSTCSSGMSSTSTFWRFVKRMRPLP